MRGLVRARRGREAASPRAAVEFRPRHRGRSQLAAAPRADQPLMDSPSPSFPRCARFNFSPAEQATFADAGAYAERYRAEAEELNDRRKAQPHGRRGARRTTASRDLLLPQIIRRNAQRGEQFVMAKSARERRERFDGREPGLLVLALLVCPNSLARLWARRLRQT